MNPMSLLGWVLLLLVLQKELSYYTHDMIFQYKRAGEWVVFLVGILVLALLTFRFATVLHQTAFGVLGIAALALMWFKQGVSQNGVLTIARGKELYTWKEIGAIRVEEGEIATVCWLKENGSLILRQTYRTHELSLLRKRVAELGIREEK